jgi:hypothetical protein
VEIPDDMAENFWCFLIALPNGRVNFSVFPDCRVDTCLS